jgi:hypothetical protein
MTSYSYNLVGDCQRFRETGYFCLEDGGNRFLVNTGNYLRDTLCHDHEDQPKPSPS